MFVVNEARVARLIAPITPYYSTPSEQLVLDGDFTTYSEIYRKQHAVRSIVDFLAGHLARIPIHTMERRETDESELDDFVARHDHECQRLLDNPNPNRGVTDFWRDAWLDYLIYDRLCFVKISDPDSPRTRTLLRIPGAWYTPFGEHYWRPEKIRILGNRGMGDIDVENCIYMHGYDPIDPRVGISPMETLRIILEEEFASTKWRRRFWDGNAQPTMVVTRPLDAPDWDGAARDRFIESLRASSSRGRPLVLEEGMTANPADAFDPKMSQYLESKQLTREEVVRAYQLPLGLFTGSGSFANTAQYRAMLYAEALPLYIERFVDELERQLLSEWDPNLKTYSLKANIDALIQGNILEQVPTLVQAAGGPFISRAEARRIGGMRTIMGDETMDKVILPMAATFGGTQEMAPDVPATAETGNEGDTGATENGGVPAIPAAFAGKAETRTKRIVERDGEFCVLAEDSDRSFGCYPTRARAEERLHQIERFAEEKAARLGVQAKARDRWQQKTQEILAAFFKRQAQSVKSKAGAGRRKFNTARWNRELADDLFKVGVATSTFFGKDVAKKLGGEFNEDITLAWWRENSRIAAENINAATEARVSVDGADLKEVFERLIGFRSNDFARERATLAANFGTLEAAKQNNLDVYKVWNTGDNPRESHKALDGERVRVNESFSNGCSYPGSCDDVNESANCNCVVTLESGR